MKLYTQYLILQTLVLIPVCIHSFAFFLGFMPAEIAGPSSFLLLGYSLTVLFSDRWVERFRLL